MKDLTKLRKLTWLYFCNTKVSGSTEDLANLKQLTLLSFRNTLVTGNWTIWRRSALGTPRWLETRKTWPNCTIWRSSASGTSRWLTARRTRRSWSSWLFSSSTASPDQAERNQKCCSLLWGVRAFLSAFPFCLWCDWGGDRIDLKRAVLERTGRARVSYPTFHGRHPSWQERNARRTQTQRSPCFFWGWMWTIWRSCFVAGGGNGLCLVLVVYLLVLWSVVVLMSACFLILSVACPHPFLLGVPYRVWQRSCPHPDDGVEGMTMPRGHLWYHWWQLAERSCSLATEDSKVISATAPGRITQHPCSPARCTSYTYSTLTWRNRSLPSLSSRTCFTAQEEGSPENSVSHRSKEAQERSMRQAGVTGLWEEGQASKRYLKSKARSAAGKRHCSAARTVCRKGTPLFLNENCDVEARTKGSLGGWQVEPMRMPQNFMADISSGGVRRQPTAVKWEATAG